MPPKQKKAPKNAYYFFMVKRKLELEAMGYRFPGGMRDVANSVGPEWALMSPVDKAPFEEQSKLAKQESKTDLTNKFTTSGESYAQLEKRIKEERTLIEEQENYLTELGSDDGALDRIFVLIKTVHCVEQIIEKNVRVYWPLELGMVAFSMRKGLLSIYWTLVDTQRTPVGYASAAKETSEETGLPEPGSRMLENYRDYNKLMKNIKGFIECWAKKGYSKGPVVFAMDQEIEHARGCIDWIAQHTDEELRREYAHFVTNLKMYKLPKLILKFAEYANRLNPTYDNVLTQFKLEHSAASIVNKGCYDYKDEITCVLHKTEKASLKMYTCCRNVVLRRMYLIFEEFLPAFGLDKEMRHDMNQLNKAMTAKSRPPRPVPSQPVRRDSQEDEDMETDQKPNVNSLMTDAYNNPNPVPVVNANVLPASYNEPQHYSPTLGQDSPPGRADDSPPGRWADSPIGRPANSPGRFPSPPPARRGPGRPRPSSPPMRPYSPPPRRAYSPPKREYSPPKRVYSPPPRRRYSPPGGRSYQPPPPRLPTPDSNWEDDDDPPAKAAAAPAVSPVRRYLNNKSNSPPGRVRIRRSQSPRESRRESNSRSRRSSPPSRRYSKNYSPSRRSSSRDRHRSKGKSHRRGRNRYDNSDEDDSDDRNSYKHKRSSRSSGGESKRSHSKRKKYDDVSSEDDEDDYKYKSRSHSRRKSDRRDRDREDRHRRHKSHKHRRSRSRDRHSRRRKSRSSSSSRSRKSRGSRKNSVRDTVIISSDESVGGSPSLVSPSALVSAVEMDMPLQAPSVPSASAVFAPPNFNIKPEHPEVFGFNVFPPADSLPEVPAPDLPFTRRGAGRGRGSLIKEEPEDVKLMGDGRIGWGPASSTESYY